MVIPWSSLRPRPLPALAGLLTLALALNAVRLTLDRPTPRSGQTPDYLSVAQNVVDGHGYTACIPSYFPFCKQTNQETAMREPVPILLFALVLALTGGSFWAAVLVQLTLDLTVLVATFLLAQELADTGTALLAASLWALYLPAIKQIGDLSGDLLGALAIALGLRFLLRASGMDRARDWLAAGVALGLGSQSRSALVAVGLGLAIALLVSRPASRLLRWANPARPLRAVLLFSLAFTLALAPWLVRNYLAFHRVVVGSTLFGYNLYRENYILGSGDYLRFVGPREASGAFDRLLHHRPDLKGSEDEAQMADVYRQEAMTVIAVHPLRYVSLSLYRLLPLWFNWKIREAYGSATTRLDYLIMLQQACLLLLALIGLRATWPRAWPLAVAIGALCAAYSAVIAQLDYLLPVMPLVMTLSAVGLRRGLAAAQPRHLRKAVPRPPQYA